MTKFEAFCARKEAEARRSTLAPWATVFERHDIDTGDQLAIGNEWSCRLFDGPFFVSKPSSDALPSTSLVFVQSRDGNTVAADPASLGGGETDKHLVYEGLSRVAADAILAGSETIRGSEIVFSVWHPELVELRRSLGLPRHPIQVVATLKGLNLVDGLLFNVPELHVVVVTVPTCDSLLRRAIDERPWVDAIVMDSPADLRNALRQLRRMGVRSLSCVGGRTLALQLVDRALVRDLYLTTGTKEGGQPNTPLSAAARGGRLVLRKIGTGPDEGVVFEHAVMEPVR